MHLEMRSPRTQTHCLMYASGSAATSLIHTQNSHLLSRLDRQVENLSMIVLRLRVPANFLNAALRFKAP